MDSSLAIIAEKFDPTALYSVPIDDWIGALDSATGGTGQTAALFHTYDSDSTRTLAESNKLTLASCVHLVQPGRVLPHAPNAIIVERQAWGAQAWGRHGLGQAWAGAGICLSNIEFS